MPKYATPLELRAAIDANPHLLWAREMCGKFGTFAAISADGTIRHEQYAAVGVQTIANELGVSVPDAAAAMGMAAIKRQQGTPVEGVAIANGESH